MDTFELTVNHRGTNRTFHGTFAKYGWSYRFTIDVDDVNIIFEPDEEGQLRAIVSPGTTHDSKIGELVLLIGNQLQKELSD